MKYKHAILGGTFDRLHTGHQSLISKALEASEKVTIGISMPDLYRNKFLSNIIEDYGVRKNYLKEYLKKNSYLERSCLIPLKDIYGNGLTEKNLDAIFVTGETFSNAEKINNGRQKLGFQPLKIITVPIIKDENGMPITSERVRNGEIDREGCVYMNIFGNKKILILPQNLREELRKPIGEIITGFEKNTPEAGTHIPVVISVGDIISISLAKSGLMPYLIIIDFITKRQKIDKRQFPGLFKINTKAYVNKHGTVNKNTVEILKKTIKKFLEKKEKQTIIINGEEDLLTLAAILTAPLNSVVFYGQSNLGAVRVEVTEEKKKQVMAILRRFL